MSISTATGQRPIDKPFRNATHYVRWLTRVPMLVVVAVTVLDAHFPPVLAFTEKLLGFEPSIGAGLALCLLLLVVERVVIIENALAHQTQLFAEQQDVYATLKGYVAEHGARDAVFLQYSGSTSLDLVRAVLREGARVTLYLQQPATPEVLGSTFQRDRIRGTHAKLPAELQEFAAQLSIYEYTPPASVSGVRIDDKVIAVGWYISKRIDSTTKAKYPAGDSVEMLAHNVPAIMAYRGTPEYDTLNKLLNDLCSNYRADHTPQTPQQLREATIAPAPRL